MITQKININKEYLKFTDKYFQRTREILEAEEINPYVRYQVFARKPGVVKGLNEAVDFVKQTSNARIFALKDGQEYKSCEPLMKLEGRVQSQVDLETVYLGMISHGLTGDIDMQEVRQRARDIFQAAKGKPVIYFGARHFYYALDEEIARICKEEGFVGASTDVGAAAWNKLGGGTTPHALIVSYAAYLKEKNLERNATVEAAKAFDRHIDPKVPRIMLIDTFNREIEDTILTAEAVPNLKGVRIDTCGENYAQGSKNITIPELNVPQEYIRGKGVTIASAWALRRAEIIDGFPNLELTVSSGFNARKTAAFIEADRVFQEKFGVPLFHTIGTGSIANPVMATADIVAYRNKHGQWEEIHKVGRPEIPTDRLEEIK